MKWSARRFLGSSMLVAALVALGCSSPPPSRHQFNDILAVANRKLRLVAVSFNKAGQKFVKEGDPSSLQSATSACRAELEDVRAEIDELQLPKNSSSAEPLLEEYKKYLAAQATIVKMMEQATAIANNNELTIPDRAAQVKNLMASMNRLGSDAWQKVDEKYRTFTEEHHFRPVDKYADSE